MDFRILRFIVGNYYCFLDKRCLVWNPMAAKDCRYCTRGYFMHINIVYLLYILDSKRYGNSERIMSAV